MAYAGVDIHKSYCQAIVCTREGDVLKEGRITTDKEDIEEFFSGLRYYLLGDLSAPRLDGRSHERRKPEMVSE